jgi:uncharacterized protein (DUF1501 family)
MINRRKFLQYGAAGTAFVSLSGGISHLLSRAAQDAAAAGANDHVLVVIELSGGNDGLNTVVPFTDPLYYKNRPTLGLPKDELIKLSDAIGLHPQMTGLGEMFKEGQLAIVQGAGYPEPDRSHFRSMEIWHTATTKTAPPTGWLGRFLDATPAKNAEQLPGLSLTYSLPQAFQANDVIVPVVSQLAELEGDEDGSPKAKLQKKLSTAQSAAANQVTFLRRQADAVYRASARIKKAATDYQSKVMYPESGLGTQLRQAAQIISSDLGTRVLFASQDGYDTHSAQSDQHSTLLSDLSACMSAFQQDMAALKVADRVLVMVFSEFGRRVDENGSQGTDHGAGSCMFVAGQHAQGGLIGQYPSLEQLGDGDLIYTTDFRSVYATLLDGWLGADADKLLGEPLARLNLLRA